MVPNHTYYWLVPDFYGVAYQSRLMSSMSLKNNHRRSNSNLSLKEFARREGGPNGVQWFANKNSQGKRLKTNRMPEPKLAETKPVKKATK